MRRGTRRIGRVGWITGLILVIAGCAATQPDVPAGEDAPSPFADCATLAGTTAPVAPAARPLPDLALPCFTGGQLVQLRGLQGPAVLNVWQSACAPCRDELPAFQRLADRFAGRVQVLGVVSRDSREGARSFAEDLRITFPNVDDREMRLQTALGRAALPVTVIVDAAGSVRHVYNGPALDDASLDALISAHLGLE